MPDGSNLASLGADEDLSPEALLERANAALLRPNWTTTWEATRKLFLPDAAPFTFTNTTPGQRDRETTVDAYGQYCLRVYAGFLYGAIVNGDGDWIKVVLQGPRGEEPTPDLLRVADDTRDELTSTLMAESTGFTEQFFAMLQERGTFGNGVLYAGDRPGGLPIVRCAPMKDAAWEGGAGHEPAAYWWRQSLTAAEWARKFPKRALGEKITEAANSRTRRNEAFTFIHGAIENPGWTPASVDQGPPKRRFLTVWLNELDKSLVSSSFLTTNPYQAFRCYRRANEIYGRGPAEEALEEASMAQRVRIAVIRSMEKAIDPTLLLPDDGIITPPTNEPEGAIVVRADMMNRQGDPIRTLRHEGRPDMGQEWLQTAIYGNIDRAFSRDLMNLPREPRMIESQIIGLQEEQSRGVVPLIAPLFAPLARFIGRIYDIRNRQGFMPRLPAHLHGWSMSIEFKNPLEKAARLAEVRAFMQALSILIQASQVDPAARHSLKVVEGCQWCFRVLGVPERFIPSEKEIQASLQEAAKIQQSQAGMEGALDMSTIAKNLSKLAPNDNTRAA
jgi:hypothetical protein